MKLRQKIGLLSGAVLLGVMAVCAGFLFLYTRGLILDMTRTEAETKQRSLAGSFASMARYYAAPSDSDTTHDSLIRYCFSRFADEEGVLQQGGRVLLSSVSIDPLAYVTEDRLDKEGTVTTNTTAGGRRVLLVSSAETVQNVKYTVSVVRDVTDVYRMIARLGWLFVGVSALGIGLGAALLYGVAKRSTRPLSRLTEAADEIAGGAYDRRVSIQAKDETAALGVSFNRMADAVQTRITELSAQNERQRLFIGGLTHECKTPLAALRLHSELLEAANLSDTERQKSLRHIASQSAYLDRIVQSLLQLLLLENEIESEPVSPAVLLKDVADTAEPSLNSRGVTLVCDCQTETPITGSPALLRSLLLNLVENAARAYDADAPDKTVTLTAAETGFVVADHGRGIPKEALPHIFDPFYRVDKSRSKKQGGSGLGLALVKAIANAHGMTVEVFSTEGEGTTFTVHRAD
ncbi:MAG: HAMP domain-containing histidine kinase [Clostridia bacterium]|nr:HAMP domain-containing histidine kinase [Clostridia bacterium]